MAHTYFHTFEIRHDECDVYGHLNNAVYLRYMQESAFRASADAGLDAAAFHEMGRLWLIRGHEIEYLHPVRGGETIEIKTWNIGVRRALARRAYEMRYVSKGTLVARAHTDWVFLDERSQRPAKIPAEVIAAYFDPGDTPHSLRKPVFPKPAPAPEGVFRVQRRVEWRDLDAMQHLNNAVYPSYAEDAAMQLAVHFDWSFKDWLDAGLAFVTRRHRIEYRLPATFEDTLEIATWLYNVRHTSATRYTSFRRLSDGEQLAQMETLWALIDLESGRPSRFPASFHDVIGPNIAK